MNEMRPRLEYISPLGNRIANPMLVDRQADALREVLERMVSRLPTATARKPAGPEKPATTQS
jgi:hypothetical protein